MSQYHLILILSGLSGTILVIIFLEQEKEIELKLNSL